MGITNRIENIIINRLDQGHGNYRYLLGKRLVGSLEPNVDTKMIFYLMAPSFTNVGDEAIVESTILYLNDMFPEFKILVVDYTNTLQMLKEIRRIVKKEDLIVLQGGGNIGTLYYDAERMREIIIEKFSDIRIISMPQSMYYDNTPDGDRKLERSKRVYNAHPDLTLIAREKYSYDNMKMAFPNCKVILNPDIVFYYSKAINLVHNNSRFGVMTCLRTDIEDVLGEKRNTLIRELVEKYNDLIISDTCVPRNIPPEVRRYEVNSIICQFMRAKMVITNRLHGMVFAALTNTPCLVMSSIDKKVIGTYEWIKDNEYIEFVDKTDVKCIINKADEMLSRDYNCFDWVSFRMKYFGDLRERIGV